MAFLKFKIPVNTGATCSCSKVIFLFKALKIDLKALGVVTEDYYKAVIFIVKKGNCILMCVCFMQVKPARSYPKAPPLVFIVLDKKMSLFF